MTTTHPAEPAFTPAPGFKLRRGIVCCHEVYSPLPVDYCPCCLNQRALEQMRKSAAKASKLKSA